MSPHPAWIAELKRRGDARSRELLAAYEYHAMRSAWIEAAREWDRTVRFVWRVALGVGLLSTLYVLAWLVRP